jgi:hypothetical protein
LPCGEVRHHAIGQKDAVESYLAAPKAGPTTTNLRAALK